MAGLTLPQVAFHGLALPVVVLAAVGATLIVRDVLLPGWRRRELSLRHHGLAVALALMMAADVGQHLYYSIGRLWPDLLPDAWHRYSHLSLIRVATLSGSIVAIATYSILVGWPWRLAHMLIFAAALWGAAGAALLAWWA